MQEKQISVIIPCYNAADYIGDCLESLVSQTIGIENMEIIIINDASTDNSEDIILQYEQKYPESIMYVPLPINGGQAHARNIGMRSATAPYLTFVDADDWVENNIYEKMLNKAREYDCDFVQCGIVEHIEGLSPHYEKRNAEDGFYDLSTPDKKKEFFEKSFLKGFIGNSLLRTEWLQKTGLEFRHFGKYEDNYFGGIIKYMMSSCYILEDYLYNYRIINNSNSHSRNDEGHFERLNVELEKLKFLYERGINTEYYEAVREDFLNAFFVNTLHIIFCQFDYIPLEIIKTMQETVKEVYPDYLEYVKQSERFANQVILVAFDYPLEIWERYKKAYLACVKGEEERELAMLYVQMREALKL